MNTNTNMQTKVLNLSTGEEQLYTCTPTQAVRSAYALENNLVSQLAMNKYDHFPALQYGKHTVTCGEWTARF